METFNQLDDADLDYDKMLVNPLITDIARRVHDIMLASHGINDTRLPADIAKELITCLQAFKRYPEEKVAWGAGFVLLRDPFGFTVAPLGPRFSVMNIALPILFDKKDEVVFDEKENTEA